MFGKVGYDPAANAQVTRQAPVDSAAEQGQPALGGGVPRVDLGTLLDKVYGAFLLCGSFGLTHPTAPDAFEPVRG